MSLRALDVDVEEVLQPAVGVGHSDVGVRTFYGALERVHEAVAALDLAQCVLIEAAHVPKVREGHAGELSAEQDLSSRAIYARAQILACD